MLDVTTIIDISDDKAHIWTWSICPCLRLEGDFSPRSRSLYLEKCRPIRSGPCAGELVAVVRLSDLYKVH